jgi:LPXTG-site transpeptidase (sortase) family protein
MTFAASVGVIAATVVVGRAPAATPPPVARVVVSTPKPTPVPAFTPSQVVIPKLRVNSPTVPVGTERDGSMGTPKSAHEIAWWRGTPAGGNGNLLLAGHRDWYGAVGSFAALGTLKPGDPITVIGQGKTLTYRVEWVRFLDANVDATTLLGPQGKPVVTLITCAGVFDTSIRQSRNRYVVRGVLAA